MSKNTGVAFYQAGVAVFVCCWKAAAAAMIGAFLGWKMAILTFFLAPFFGAFFGIIEKIRTKDTAIAYGPFLCLAAVICLFKGDEILQWVLRGYGLY